MRLDFQIFLLSLRFCLLHTNPDPKTFQRKGGGKPKKQKEQIERQNTAAKVFMANMMVYSSKALITASYLPTTSITSASTSKPRFQLPHISPLPKIKITKHQCDKILASSLKSSAAIAAAVLVMAPPSMAVEMEKAALFDFNLTLPAIVIEFLLLMVGLDKIYFTPLGKFMDERDSAIKEKLNSVKDTSSEVKQLEDQAAAVMKAARAEISAALNQMKKETTLEVEQKLAEGRQKVEAELAEALSNLEKQKEETIKALDSQIAALSDEIVKKVLPVSPN